MGSDAGRRRLLVLTSTYPRWRGDHEPGFVHELAKRLVHDFDVTVLGPHAAGASPIEELDGVHVRRFRYAPSRLEVLVNDGGIITNLRRHPWRWLLVPSFLLAQAWATRCLIGRLRPDVVHAHWLLPQGLVAALVSRRAPLVVTSHGADLFAISGRFYRVLRGFVLKRIAAVTVVSAAMRDRLRDDYPQAEARVMPMGVDFSQFTPDPTVQRVFGSILFVGRLVAKKGLVHLLDAMPKVLKRIPHARLDIVGFGPDLPELLARASALGIAHRVAFHGAVPQAQLPARYRAAAVCAAPFVEARGGDQEGLGLVVVEAIGCHCPVVVGDVPGVHDVVEASSAAIVPQADPNALADALIAVLLDPSASAERAARARARLLSRLSWDTVAAGYSELLIALARSDVQR